jgi:hypothetical protein
MSAIARYLAALHSPRKVPEYVKEDRVIVTKMTGNIHFPNEAAFLVIVGAHIDLLDTAEQATHKGPKGAVADRDAKLMVVRSDMRLLKGHVQAAADADLPNSKSIIESSGMYVVLRTFRSKPQLAVRYGAVPTMVDLIARASKTTASYGWQMSADQKNWVDLPGTVTANTTVTGLTPGLLYAFRFRTLTVAGLSDWSMVATIIAH